MIHIDKLQAFKALFWDKKIPQNIPPKMWTFLLHQWLCYEFRMHSTKLLKKDIFGSFNSRTRQNSKTRTFTPFVRTQKSINFRSSGIISMRSRTLRKFFALALIPELPEKVKPELSHLSSELRIASISEVLELFHWKAELCESTWVRIRLGLG